jgi:hypothetical protein
LKSFNAHSLENLWIDNVSSMTPFNKVISGLNQTCPRFILVGTVGFFSIYLKIKITAKDSITPLMFKKDPITPGFFLASQELL